MRIITEEGLDLTITQEELTVLRRNVALLCLKERREKEDGEIEIRRQRRPHWAGFQQRLVWPAELEFIWSNPLDDEGLRVVVARMLKNLKRAEDSVGWEGFKQFTAKRLYTLDERRELLRLCEEKVSLISPKLEPGKTHLILAYVDLLVLCWELDQLVWALANDIQDPAPLSGREGAVPDFFRP